MSMDLYLTNDKNPNYANKEYTLDDINYLNKRLSYLEKNYTIQIFRYFIFGIRDLQFKKRKFKI